VLALCALVVAALIFLTPRDVLCAVAVTITALVQLVAVFLVFASPIVPTLAAHAAPRHLRLVAGYVFGFTGYVLGRRPMTFRSGPPSSAYSAFLALPPQWC
jgi:hypothetical protein